MHDQTKSPVADLERIEAKLDALATTVGKLAETQAMLGSFYREMMPLATVGIESAAARLSELEQRGYFDFGRELLHVVDAVVAGYTPDDVHALADNVVRILDGVRAVTQPDALDFYEHAVEAVEDQGENKPKGLLSTVRTAMKDDDVRRGVAVAIEAIRQIGRAVNHRGASPSGHPMNPLLGPKRNLKRSPSKGARAGEGTRLPKTPTPRVATPAPPTTPAPSPPAPASTSAAGLALDSEGFLADSAAWTQDFAREVAQAQGITLTDRHWTVLNFMRDEYAQTKSTPNIRRITIGAGVPTKELFQLFPRAPAKTAARIAGLPKPVGCV